MDSLMTETEYRATQIREPTEIDMPPAGYVWVILHTRPRCEKKLRIQLEREGVSVYLPLKKKTHRYGARQREFLSPLFPGYIFCMPAAKASHQLRQNQYVANVLRVIDQETLVHQLRQIRHALAAGDIVEIMPYLEKGKPVRVIGGPLRGLEGVVETIKRKTRVIISVDMIRQSVFVEVESMHIEAV